VASATLHTFCKPGFSSGFSDILTRLLWYRGGCGSGMLEIVFSSGAWTAAVSAVAAAAVIAAVTLLRDYLRLESRARSLQSENELLMSEIQSLTNGAAERDARGSRPVPGQRRGANAQAAGGTAPAPSRFACAVESARRAS
jgi:hypothetical protein